MDISEDNRPAAAPATDLSGAWDLKIDFQGQKVPVELQLTQTDGRLSGQLESMLGTGAIENGRVDGLDFTAVAVIALGGQPVELKIDGRLDGDDLKGTLAAPMIPAPLEFEGRRR